MGLASLVGKPATESSVLVQVLLDQGAIPFVKTNVSHLMISWETLNPTFGYTSNAHCPGRSAGGSSGGEGALVGGGGSVLGWGSDIGGSIRIPSSMNGVYGLRPTSERISSKGIVPVTGGQITS